MKSFYEKKRDDESVPRVHISENHSFPSHFHANLEILIVLKGAYTLMLNGERYPVEENSIAVVDSYDVHGYERTKAHGASDARIVILPYPLLHKFNAERKNLRVASPIIKDEELCKKLVAVADEYLLPDNPKIQSAGTELFLAFLTGALSFTTDNARGEGALIRAILSFIQERYKGECTRAAIAHALGYAEAHISRVFHKYLKMGISQYVNGLRLDYVDYCKRMGDERSTVDLVFGAGFSSMQTYYRQKAKRND